MSDTNRDPQNYDPYLDTLLKYEEGLKQIQELLEKNKDKIALEDYNNLIVKVKGMLAEIKVDIKERKEEEIPSPEDDSYKEKPLWKRLPFGNK